MEGYRAREGERREGMRGGGGGREEREQMRRHELESQSEAGGNFKTGSTNIDRDTEKWVVSLV